jgi:hypothetical protein
MSGREKGFQQRLSDLDEFLATHAVAKPLRNRAKKYMEYIHTERVQR